MNNAIIQLLILAAVAVFLVFRLKNLLGTREGFEKSAENTVVKICLLYTSPSPRD